MAEVAALAQLTGVVCCGLKLSTSLYDFATSLGSAGREIKTLGSDITLFCSVLKQVQSTIEQAHSSFRISPKAICTTEEIMQRASTIFEELFSVFAKLQNDEELPVDFETRVRWTFKRAKVLLLRESLQSCTIMLHLMLTTMSFAQRIATQGTAFDDEAEDEEERGLTQSLCLAHQSTNERLEELEKECLAEEAQRSDSVLTVLASQQEQYKSYSLERFEEDSYLEPAPPESILDDVTIESGVRASRMTSLLLGTILEHRGSSCLTWASISSQRQSVLDSDKLLRNWTDQQDPIAWQDIGSKDESIMPTDNVSRYHGRSLGELTVHNFSTFFESMTSASDLLVEERHPITTIHSVDAADRSRRKVAKLTGQDYTTITPDWMWKIDVETDTTVPFPLPSLEPFELKEPSKPRKKSKQLRWLNHRIDLTDSDDLHKEIEERLRCAGLI